MTTNQNSLDAIVEYLRKGILEAQLQPSPKSTKVLDHYEKHTKELITAWHHQQTTKDMLALIGEAEPVETIEAVGDGIFHTPKGEVSHGRNLLRTELRQAIQGREEQ